MLKDSFGVKRVGRRGFSAGLASVFACLACSLLSPRVAHASDPLAEKLYQEGRKAVDAKDWTTACAKFYESYHREAAPGTLLNLANCEEMRGELAQAMNHFQVVAGALKAGDKRIAYANQRAVALARRVPTLTLVLQLSSAVGTSVERDGVMVEGGAFGTPVPVDPGEHVIVVRAPGRLDVRSSVRIEEGESRTIELTSGMPALDESTPVERAEAPPPVSTVTTMPFESSPRPTETDRGTPFVRTLGFVSIGLGVAGIGLGIAGSVMVLDAKGTVGDHCKPDCDADGASAQRTGKTWSTIGTIGTVGGLVAAGAGVSMLLLAPKSRSVAVGATPLVGGMALSTCGTF